MGFRDIVIAGPDMSGTSTQVKGVIDHLVNKGLTYKDMRGTEIDALFHVDDFSFLNMEYSSLKEFIQEGESEDKETFFYKAYDLLSGLKVASMVDSPATSFIHPEYADLWVFEEPTYRGAGQVIRTIEQNRSTFGMELNPENATKLHQAYRTDEFLRFRGPLREAGKIILRSRSEESACYQVRDNELLQNGPGMMEYLEQEGHMYAFRHAPTQVIVVHAPTDWTIDEFRALREERSGSRELDDHEKNIEYQLMVNKRYASDWIDELYHAGTSMHGGKMPRIHKVAMYDNNRNPRSIDEIQEEINKLI